MYIRSVLLRLSSPVTVQPTSKSYWLISVPVDRRTAGVPVAVVETLNNCRRTGRSSTLPVSVRVRRPRNGTIWSSAHWSYSITVWYSIVVSSILSLKCNILVHRFRSHMHQSWRKRYEKKISVTERRKDPSQKKISLAASLTQNRRKWENVFNCQRPSIGGGTPSTIW